MKFGSFVALLAAVTVMSNAYAQSEKTVLKDNNVKDGDNCAASCMTGAKPGEQIAVFGFKSPSKKDFSCSSMQAGGGDPCGNDAIFKQGQDLCKSKGKHITMFVVCSK